MSSPSNTTVFDITLWPNAVAAVMLFLNSAIGLLFNVIVVYYFIIDKRQKTSFNLICVFRAINNIFILVVAFLLVFLPAIVTGHALFPPLIESILIAFSVNLKIYNEFQGIYLGFNRFVAVFFPIRYNTVFGIKPTLFLHFLYYLDRIWNVTQEAISRNEASNYLLFSTEHLAYGGLMVTPDGMFIWAIGLLLAPFVVNAFTFVRIYYLKKRTSHDSEHRQKAKRNASLFLQTVLQDSLYSISVIFSMKFNTYIDHRFWTYFTQTFMWQCVHVFDGFIMLMFNEKLKLLKRAVTAKVSPAETRQGENSAKQTTATLAHVVQ